MGFGKKIVVTGMGAVSALGNDVASFWDGLIHGWSGIDRVRAYDPTDFPVRIAGEVDERDLTRLIPDALPACPLSHCPHRTVLLSIAAAAQAVLASGLDPNRWDPTRLGLYLGNGIGTLDFPELAGAVKGSFEGDQLSIPKFMNRALEVCDPQRELEFEADVAIDSIAVGWNIQGPCSLSMTACAASSQAIGEACYWIGKGEVDVVLAGGAHSIVDPFGMTGFGHLTALSTRNDDPKRASRPFDKDRDGFVLAEGAGMLILESEESAHRRGAPILAEISGYGLSTDAYRVTDADPEGATCVNAMQSSLDCAEVGPEGIDLVNAHGTSTYANDRTETQALKNLFGPDLAYRVPVHSIKSMIGHAIAAAGALELIAAIQTLRERIVPPTINQETPDPECDLDYVPNFAREKDVSRILSNSFGFGGQNVSLVVGKYHG
jgi:3-oxoacyl-[acyl-carrier-protein] synthase II